VKLPFTGLPGPHDLLKPIARAGPLALEFGHFTHQPLGSTQDLVATAGQTGQRVFPAGRPHGDVQDASPGPLHLLRSRRAPGGQPLRGFLQLGKRALLLDVATGTAGVALQIAHRTPASVVGLDLTRAMLAQGRSRVTQDPAGARVTGRIAAMPQPSKTSRARAMLSGDFSPHRTLQLEFDSVTRDSVALPMRTIAANETPIQLAAMMPMKYWP